jgi:hypothetical protein
MMFESYCPLWPKSLVVTRWRTAKLQRILSI